MGVKWLNSTHVTVALGPASAGNVELVSCAGCDCRLQTVACHSPTHRGLFFCTSLSKLYVEPKQTAAIYSSTAEQKLAAGHVYQAESKVSIPAICSKQKVSNRKRAMGAGGAAPKSAVQKRGGRLS